MKKQEILVVTPDGKTHRIHGYEMSVKDTSVNTKLQCIDKENGKLVIKIKDTTVAVFKEWSYWMNGQLSTSSNT